MMDEFYQRLFEVLDRFLDACDREFDEGEHCDLRRHYLAINRALDGIYRGQQGIPQPDYGGRPRKDPQP